jgi:hypothetical protein
MIEIVADIVESINKAIIMTVDTFLCDPDWVSKTNDYRHRMEMHMAEYVKFVGLLAEVKENGVHNIELVDINTLRIWWTPQSFNDYRKEY